VIVNVNYAVAQGTYGIEYRAGSTTKRLGDIHIREGQGSWGSIAPLPAAGSGSVVLVDDTGNVVCEGRLPPISERFWRRRTPMIRAVRRQNGMRQCTGWPSPMRFPSLSWNHAARSPTPPFDG
jgi:hypothetical protein